MHPREEWSFALQETPSNITYFGTGWCRIEASPQCPLWLMDRRKLPFRLPGSPGRLSAKVNRIISKAASLVLGGGTGIQLVIREPIRDSVGHDALRVTIVLKRGSANRITGDNVVDALVEIHTALEKQTKDGCRS